MDTNSVEDVMNNNSVKVMVMDTNSVKVVMDDNSVDVDFVEWEGYTNYHS